jgi:hypothetical protein
VPDKENEMSQPDTIDKQVPAEIRVTVTFPVSKNGAFKADYTPEATVGEVRMSAMNHFGVADSVTGDTQLTYVLTHGGKRQENTTTLGSIAGEARALPFRLVKVITQG